MPLPHWVARLNRRFTNRFVEPLARRSERYVVIHHTGRVSGSRYKTPVYVFGTNEYLHVALTYGPTADWVRNVLAGGGTCEGRDGRTAAIVKVSLVGRSETWSHLPRLIRFFLRILRVRDFLRFRLTD